MGNGRPFSRGRAQGKRGQLDEPRDGAPLRISHQQDNPQANRPKSARQNQHELLRFLRRRNLTRTQGRNGLL